MKSNRNNSSRHRRNRKSIKTSAIILIWCFFFLCTTKPIINEIKDCPQPLWKKYSSFHASQVKEEITRLQALLAAGDTLPSDKAGKSDENAESKKLTGIEIRERLFELSIHSSNPEFNFDKILEYASFLYQNGGSDSLRYRNWGRAVREYDLIRKQRDSLADIITQSLKAQKNTLETTENLKKEIKTYIKQRDSLIAVINSQQETITKLQKLDLIMEQQRTRIR